MSCTTYIIILITTYLQDCNNFLAGNMLRSANRYKALEETAVFGYCCRHEFPGEFINLKHGERLVNISFVIIVIKNKKTDKIYLGQHMVSGYWKESYKRWRQSIPSKLMSCMILPALWLATFGYVYLSLYTVIQHVFLQSLGRSDILNNIHLCLPTFHSYGHKVSCQVKCQYVLQNYTLQAITAVWA